MNGDVLNGGSGVNMFANPAQVFSEFRPFILGVDTRTGGAGTVTGQSRWNLDLGLTKDTQFTERVGAQIFVQAFNALNHPNFGQPDAALGDGSTGIISTMAATTTSPYGSFLGFDSSVRVTQISGKIIF